MKPLSQKAVATGLALTALAGCQQIERHVSPDTFNEETQLTRDLKLIQTDVKESATQIAGGTLESNSTCTYFTVEKGLPHNEQIEVRECNGKTTIDVLDPDNNKIFSATLSEQKTEKPAKKVWYQKPEATTTKKITEISTLSKKEERIDCNLEEEGKNLFKCSDDKTLQLTESNVKAINELINPFVDIIEGKTDISKKKVDSQETAEEAAKDEAKKEEAAKRAPRALKAKRTAKRRPNIKAPEKQVPKIAPIPSDTNGYTEAVNNAKQ